jgi:hypothetical protein
MAAPIAEAGPFVPTPRPPFAAVHFGGHVIANPKVVGVFFSDYDNTMPVAAMLAGLPTVMAPNGKNFWAEAVSEYGVGPLTALPPVMLTQSSSQAPHATNPAAFVQYLVAGKMLPNVDSSTIVAVFYPSSVRLGGSCADPAVGMDALGHPLGWGGYHAISQTSQGPIPFGVIAECANYGSDQPALDMVTGAGSHEIIEAATDPSNGGLTGVDTSSDFGWAMHVLLAGNEENGDMCNIMGGHLRPSMAYPYWLSRGWSNKAVMAGDLDPCQPDDLPAQPFVGAYPVMTDTVNLGRSSGKGALIAVGASKTIEVDCFSFQATAPFTVGAHQPRRINPPELTFMWDKTTCSNGEKLHLTIAVQSRGANGYEPFTIYTQIPGAADPQKPIWPAVVAQQ